MSVMAARMHLTRHSRRKRHAALFEYGECVHVRTQQYTATRLAGSQDADDASFRDAGLDLIAQPAQAVRDDARGAHFFEAQLGMQVDVTAELNDVRNDCTRHGDGRLKRS